VVGEAPSHAGGAIYIFAPGIGTIPPAVPLKVNLAPQVYRRAPQIIGVRTLPNAHVDLKVIYPGGSAVRAAGTTDRAGFWRYGWIVRAGKAGTATVSIMVTSGSKRRHFTKHFKIL
jgi:hypothetical protein